MLTRLRPNAACVQVSIRYTLAATGQHSRILEPNPSQLRGENANIADFLASKTVACEPPSMVYPVDKDFLRALPSAMVAQNCVTEAMTIST